MLNKFACGAAARNANTLTLRHGFGQLFEDDQTHVIEVDSWTKADDASQWAVSRLVVLVCHCFRMHRRATNVLRAFAFMFARCAVVQILRVMLVPASKCQQVLMTSPTCPVHCTALDPRFASNSYFVALTTEGSTHQRMIDLSN